MSASNVNIAVGFGVDGLEGACVAVASRVAMAIVARDIAPQPCTVATPTLVAQTLPCLSVY